MGQVSKVPDYEIIDQDIVLDIILDILDIHWVISSEIGEIGEIGDLPPGDLPITPEGLEVIIENPEVREIVAKRVREAQAEGNDFPLPSGQELAAARERQLRRRQRGSS